MGRNGGRELTFLKWRVAHAAPLNPTVLPFRRSDTNPYESSLHSPDVCRTKIQRPGLRFSVLAVAVLAGIGNTSAALIDAYREGYPTGDGYLFIGITTLIPISIAVIGMFILIGRRMLTYLIWSTGSIVAILPGLLAWSLCAALPSPRVHSGAGQMHIFFLPIIHIGYSLLIYSGTGILVMVASQKPNP